MAKNSGQLQDLRIPFLLVGGSAWPPPPSWRKSTQPRNIMFGAPTTLEGDGLHPPPGLPPAQGAAAGTATSSNVKTH